MSHFIDRRIGSKRKSAVNRQRFLKRYKSQLKRAVADAVNRRSIVDTDAGEKVKIPSRDVSEPVFHHGPGGTREGIHPGNKEFVAGDRLQRPQGGAGDGSGDDQASDSGEGEDDFVFELTRDEYLDLLFDDLELPNLVRNQLAGATEFKTIRAGYSTDGAPSNIDVVRSLKGAIARRTALGAPYRGRIRELEEELTALLDGGAPETDVRVIALREEITQLRSRIAVLPFIDTFDLRYKSFAKQPEPTSKAVMFCLMDVSGSMDEQRKNLAKRFFLLLHLFLQRNYDKIDVVFIRHHTTAMEVDEQEFFYSRETGGTVVSSALHLVYDVIRDRYDSSGWNIYVAQASDGDNWESDSPVCRDLLAQKLMPLMRYYAYVEIMPRHHQALWYAYQELDATEPNFAMQQIDAPEDVYAVFRELFKRQPA
jgi:uncharacterized sporulation protein YeaH/YhbH (DUF444 family)